MNTYPILISEISLENFRVFKNKCSFELAPITILTGANSSGKSSVIKALNLMKDFYDEDENSFSFNKHNEMRISKFCENGTFRFPENYPLDFNKENKENYSYHHQLGNFEMVLNKENKDKDEFSITCKNSL